MKYRKDQIDYLISLEKKVIGDFGLLEELEINQNVPFHQRLILQSEEDDEFSFLWEITQNSKMRTRLSLHVQEDEGKIGLIRIDYNAGHKNPEVATSNLPAKFLPYIGKQFTNSESHIHYYVENYKSLAWAIPLQDITFKPLNIIDNYDLNNNFAEAICEFAKLINLSTKLTINALLI